MSLPLGSSNCCWNRVLVILHVVHVKSTHFTSLYVASCRGLALPWAKSVIQMLQHLSFKTNFCCLGAFLRYICPVDVRAGRTFGPAPLHSNVYNCQYPHLPLPVQRRRTVYSKSTILADFVRFFLTFFPYSKSGMQHASLACLTFLARVVN